MRTKKSGSLQYVQEDRVKVCRFSEVEDSVNALLFTGSHSTGTCGAQQGCWESAFKQVEEGVPLCSKEQAALAAWALPSSSGELHHERTDKSASISADNGNSFCACPDGRTRSFWGGVMEGTAAKCINVELSISKLKKTK